MSAEVALLSTTTKLQGQWGSCPHAPAEARQGGKTCPMYPLGRSEAGSRAQGISG